VCKIIYIMWVLRERDIGSASRACPQFGVYMIARAFWNGAFAVQGRDGGWLLRNTGGARLGESALRIWKGAVERAGMESAPDVDAAVRTAGRGVLRQSKRSVDISPRLNPRDGRQDRTDLRNRFPSTNGRSRVWRGIVQNRDRGRQRNLHNLNRSTGPLFLNFRNHSDPSGTCTPARAFLGPSNAKRRRKRRKSAWVAGWLIRVGTYSNIKDVMLD